MWTCVQGGNQGSLRDVQLLLESCLLGAEEAAYFARRFVLQVGSDFVTQSSFSQHTGSRRQQSHMQLTTMASCSHIQPVRAER